MKKCLVFSLILICLVHKNYADMYFPNTLTETVIEDSYSETKVKGKAVITVNVFPKQIYYAFVSFGDITIVNCPYPIKEIVLGGRDIVTTEYKKDSAFFTIKTTSGSPGQETTLQVICQNGFTALLNVKIGQKEDSNRVIHLQDGKDVANAQIYTRERFEQLKQHYNDGLKQRETALTFLFFNDSKKYPLGETIKVGDSSLTIKNITICNNVYFYNLEFVGNDKMALNKEDIFLYLTNYNNFILSEDKKYTLCLYPKDILLYTSENGTQCATISFEVEKQHQGQTFYSQLHIAKSIIFDNKVNLDLLKVDNKDLFNVQVR